ncbi:MAG: von Willebrand factor type A domain-containing protein [Planctomycetaceae bacterium]|jgi:Ca-activated chloride channel family protein|nr:von Willebrand factor type A domain-containing protein [Planctomycetaceae bacterium]
MTITINDPKLTAFVLGELSDDEMREMQAAIDADAELQKEVAEIRNITNQITLVMKNEPLPNDTVSTKPKKRHWLISAAIITAAASLLIAALVPLLLPPKETAVAQYSIDAADVDEEKPALSQSAAQQEQAPESAIVKKDKWSRVLAETSSSYDNSDTLVPESGIKGRGRESLKSSNKPDTVTQWSRPVTVGRAGQPLSSASESPSNSLAVSGTISGSTVLPLSGSFDGSNTALGGKASGNVSEISKLEYPSSKLIDNEFNMGMMQPSDRKIPLGRKDIADEEKLSRDPYNSANAEAYKEFTENEFKPVKVGEFSTFSIDVDSASYTAMRRYINETNQRPPVVSVRLEEYVNYFKYDYAPPTDGKPFATHVDVSPCPWEPKHLLARIGIKGKEYSVDERPPLNLVFLIDVSGSMSASNRLPLVKRGLTELVEMLQSKDRVAIVTYAGESRVALPSVSGQEKQAILDSINGLGAGGSTAGAAGIKTAYEVARKYYDKKSQNRVILCTDGDFNVGETNNKTLEEMIGDEAKSGVFLTILGFGMGNYKDDRLKTLSMRGNGNYGYIDTIEEARRLLVEGLTGTLFAIAKDVKIQVDFNPAKITGYRLLGYENRKLRDEDFHNDKVDAGEIGAGHTVTALYEIVPIGENLPTAVDKSRYDKEPKNTPEISADTHSIHSDELLFVKLRYKEPDGDKSSLLEYPVTAASTKMSADSQFAAAVALYGMLLRNSQHSGNGTYDTVLELAMPNVKDDSYRKEFIELVKKAKELK